MNELYSNKVLKGKNSEDMAGEEALCTWEWRGDECRVLLGPKWIQVFFFDSDLLRGQDK